MGQFVRAFLACAAIGLVSASSLATPGGVDARGCHQSKTIGYHCHAGRARVGVGGESPGERDARMRRECRSAPNAGACLGYGK